MKLTEWTIVKLNTAIPCSYIIGVNKNGEICRSSYVEDYSINNDYLKLVTEDTTIYKLPYKHHFEPTYVDKSLYRWSVSDYHYNNIPLCDTVHKLTAQDMISHESLNDVLLGRYLTGYRSKDRNQNLFDTTKITHIELHPRYILAHTESGSSYRLYLTELFI